MKWLLDMGFDDPSAGFFGMVENIDENLGRLMTKMDEWEVNFIGHIYHCEICISLINVTK